MIDTLSHGYNLEAAIVIVAGLWLLATGGSDGADKYMARRAPSPGTGARAYFAKADAIAAGHRKRNRWPWRIAGMAMIVGAAYYCTTQAAA